MLMVQKVIQVATLQEMLDQPLLKKALWHSMQCEQNNKIWNRYEAESRCF